MTAMVAWYVLLYRKFLQKYRMNRQVYAMLGKALRTLAFYILFLYNKFIVLKEYAYTIFGKLTALSCEMRIFAYLV